MSYAPEPGYVPGTPGIDPRSPLPPGDGRSRILGGGRGSREKRNVLVAVISTVAFFGVVAFLIVRSPGWERVQETFFDREVFWYSLPKILERFVTNIFIFVVAEVVVLVFALMLAVLRSLQGSVFTPLRLLAIGYVDLFRGVPTILVILLLGFGMPALALEGVPKSERFWAIVALILVYSAYVAEVYRAGIESVHPSQSAAARSLGLSRSKTMRHVVLPQAVRRVIPPLLNDFIGLQKDSALVFVLGVVEGLGQANIIASAKFDYTPFVALALVYVLITIPQTRLVDHMIERDRRRRMAATPA
jgi:polar amino acid transport system permease protein